MSDLSETASWVPGIYELETVDPVQGGPTGVSNTQAGQLANRTGYLKAHVDDLEAAVAAIQAALGVLPDTQAAGNSSQSYATTAFVHRAQGGFVSVDISAGGNVVLTSDQWGCAVIILTGALPGNTNVIFPARGDIWLVVNRTTGSAKTTCKTASGSGVTVAQGRSKAIFCDGTNVGSSETDLSTRPRTISAATLLAAGDDVTVDFSASVFALTLPASPQDGDQVRIRGNFLTSNLTVLRNGKLIADETGTAQGADYQINRNNASDVLTYVVPTTGSAYWLVTQG
jgi:hypothetical protein